MQWSTQVPGFGDMSAATLDRGYRCRMNPRTVLKVLGGATVGAFLIALARVTDEDIYEHRRQRLRRYYDKHPRWTDVNRWE